MPVKFLTLDEIIAVHRRQIEVYGGGEGIRDVGLVEAALLRPQNGYYDDLIEQAAALWESLAMNHGFIDGNKRVAFAATYIFLGMNGYVIEAEEEEVADLVLGLLESGSFTKDNLDAWLRQNTKPV